MNELPQIPTEAFSYEPPNPRGARPANQPQAPSAAFTQPSAPPARSPMDVRDVARSGAAQAGLGLVADVPGMVGSLGQLYDMGRDTVLKYGVLKPLEAIGAMPAHSADRFIQQSRALGRDTPQGRGDVNYVLGLPFGTPKAYERAAKRFIPGLDYQTRSPEGEGVGKATRLGASMIAPGDRGLRGAAERFGAGFAGSAIGQQVSSATEASAALSGAYQPWVEPVMSTLAALGAGAMLRGGSRVANPTAPAEDGLASAMSKDFAANPRLRQILEDAQSTGTPVSIADVFGRSTHTRAYIEKQAGLSGRKDLVAQYNAQTAGAEGSRTFLPRLPEAQARIHGLLGYINRGEIDAPVIAAAQKAANDLARNYVYQVAKSMPQARAIPESALGPVAQNALVREAMDEVMRLAPSMPANRGIVAPRPDPRSPGSMTPGNLVFWDAVKKRVDDKRTNLRDAPGSRNRDLYDALTGASQELRRRLDIVVPAYGTARARAGVLFGQEDAVQAGREFYRNINSYDRADFTRQFNAMDPQARQFARTAWLHELSNNVFTPNGIGAVAQRFLSDGAFQAKARTVLGRDYDLVRGKIVAEDLRNAAAKIAEVAPKNRLAQTLSSGATMGAAGTTVSVLTHGLDALQQAVFSAQMVPAAGKLMPAILAGGIGVGVSSARQIQAKRVADQVVRLATSENMPDIVRLSRLMDREPGVARAIANINIATQGLRPRDSDADAEPPPTERPQRASGGRVRISDRLMMAVERARRQVQAETKPILDAPDETVVRALKVAQQHI